MQLAEFIHFYAPFCCVFFRTACSSIRSDAKSLREFRLSLNVRPNCIFLKLSVDMVLRRAGLVILFFRADEGVWFP
jgi:hypothetical protein